ncbi:holin, partial [Streptococcus iniae]
MTINTEQAIAWMAARQGKVTYSMDYRNGPSSYDCSSSIYFALRSAGAS